MVAARRIGRIAGVTYVSVYSKGESRDGVAENLGVDMERI